RIAIVSCFSVLAYRLLPIALFSSAYNFREVIPSVMTLPTSLGELRKSEFNEQRLKTRRVKDELRDNLIQKLRTGETIFSGIVGYDDSVVPQLINAVLSRHNFILLGLRGQAKSRMLRALTGLLDPYLPYVMDCEIHDDPYDPLCRRC